MIYSKSCNLGSLHCKSFIWYRLVYYIYAYDSYVVGSLITCRLLGAIKWKEITSSVPLASLLDAMSLNLENVKMHVLLM